MTHWIILPVLLPAMTGAAMMLVMRRHLRLQRVFSLASCAAMLVLTLGLAFGAADGTITVYELGNWPAPFGIVLVADRLSTMMTLLTAALAMVVVLYAIGSGWDRRGWHFHPLVQFQVMGILGAFLTGDAFNLFVFFEILLIASYGLMIHAGGARRLRAGTQYVIYNLLGSTLFLFALGTLYGVTGTLNMADLAVRVAELPADETALIRVGAVLLLLVFAVKAAVLPLHFWLPESYANAPAPVAALFAIMTKVGAYGILRMYTLVFPPELEATAGLFDAWLMPAALLTLAVGMIGVLAAGRLERLVAFAVIGSMGTLLVAVSLFTPQATTAALYYVLHSTLATAALFLTVDLVSGRRGTGDVVALPPVAQNGLIAALFFVGAIAMAGLPPLSGFVGKLLVMDAARESGQMVWVWPVILVTSLIAVVGFARAGSTVFWKSAAVVTPDDTPAAPAPRPAALPFVSVGALLSMLVAITVLAGPLTAYLDTVSDQLYAPEAYIEAVLGPQEEV